MVVTWDTNNTGGNGVFSNGNLTITSGSGSWNSTRATQGLPAGKWYFEATIDNNGTVGGSNGDFAVGIANTNLNMSSTPGAVSSTAVMYYPQTGLVFSNGGTSTIQTGAVSHVVCVAFDTTAKLIWWRVDGGNWNNAAIGSQDPAAGIGGKSFSSITHGNWYPNFGFESTDAKVTANFGATSFTQTVPTGYSSVSSYAPPATGNTIIWNPSDKAANLTLLENNLRGKSTTSGTWQTVRANQSYTTGQFYLEFTADYITSNVIIGVCNASETLASHNLGQTSSTGLGYELNNNSILPGGTSPGVGHVNDIIGVKYDFGAKTISFNINGGTFSTATSFSAITGPYFPAMSSFSPGDNAIVNFGETAFSNTIPSGYSSFASSYTPLAVSQSAGVKSRNRIFLFEDDEFQRVKTKWTFWPDLTAEYASQLAVESWLVTPPYTHVTSLAAEAFVSDTTSSVHASQIGVEAFLNATSPTAHVTQLGVESWLTASTGSEGVITSQIAAEAWLTPSTTYVHTGNLAAEVFLSVTAVSGSVLVSKIGSETWLAGLTNSLRVSQLGFEVWFTEDLSNPTFTGSKVGLQQARFQFLLTLDEDTELAWHPRKRVSTDGATVGVIDDSPYSWRRLRGATDDSEDADAFWATQRYAHLRAMAWTILPYDSFNDVIWG